MRGKDMPIVNLYEEPCMYCTCITVSLSVRLHVLPSLSLTLTLRNIHLLKYTMHPVGRRKRRSLTMKR